LTLVLTLRADARRRAAELDGQHSAALEHLRIVAAGDDPVLAAHAELARASMLNLLERYQESSAGLAKGLVALGDRDPELAVRLSGQLIETQSGRATWTPRAPCSNRSRSRNRETPAPTRSVRGSGSPRPSSGRARSRTRIRARVRLGLADHPAEHSRATQISALTALGRVEEARALADETLARVQTEYGAALRRAGRRGVARELLKQARELAHACGAAGLEPRTLFVTLKRWSCISAAATRN
jgi:hypothetical protein